MCLVDQGAISWACVIPCSINLVHDASRDRAIFANLGRSRQLSRVTGLTSHSLFRPAAVDPKQSFQSSQGKRRAIAASQPCYRISV